MVLSLLLIGLGIARLRTWLDSHQHRVIILICLPLGLWLVGNSIYLLLSYA